METTPASSNPRPSTRARLAWILALCIGTIAVYTGVAWHDFAVIDDLAYVEGNPRVTSGLSLANLGWALTTGTEANWHPLTWLSLQLDVQLFGVSAGAMKLVNLAFHLVSVVLLVTLLDRWTRAFGASLFVGAVFALHPVHVESVAWIAERKDVLSHVFFVLVLHAWTTFVERGGTARYGVALALFGLGLTAKPMLVTLPCLLLVLEYWPLGALRSHAARRGVVARLREIAPFLALAIASSVVTFLVQRAGGAVAGLERAPIEARVENAVVAYVRYLGFAFWPAELSVLHGFKAWTALQVGGAVAAILALGAWAWRGRREAPWRFTGLAWYFGTLVPVVGLVQVGYQSIAHRYAYLPLTGAVLALALEIAEHVRARPLARRAVTALSLVAIALCAWRTHHELRHWRDGITLMERALAIEPHNVPARRTLALALERAGRMEEARTQLDRAGVTVRQQVEASIAIARERERAGDPNEAERLLRSALALMPKHSNARYELASLLARSGRSEPARAELAELLAHDQDHAPAHALVGRLAMERGDYAAAAAAYVRAHELLPGDPRALRAALLSAAEAGWTTDVARLAPETAPSEPTLESELDASLSRALERARARGDTAASAELEALLRRPSRAQR